MDRKRERTGGGEDRARAFSSMYFSKVTSDGNCRKQITETKTKKALLFFLSSNINTVLLLLFLDTYLDKESKIKNKTNQSF